VIVYGIYSGKLEELKGPGGLEAKFTKTANESISIASEEVAPSVEEMQNVTKRGVNILDKNKLQLNESQPIIMTMELGKFDYYRREAVLAYLEYLSNFRNFVFVVFLDNNQKFVAYMASWAVKELLKKQELGNEFIEVINRGNRIDLLHYPGVISETIQTQSTNTEALQEMTKQNLDALIVTDKENKLKGVVERGQVISRMILSVIK
jgi:signal-transduction protein with cAMP-binding, CBS, and nucleotidyltransferase domain